ncbi:MAG: VOC family protein [Deltaproteobacteria bacterium]|nr:VOC family protein [Deltaproteobacteria bacterium]
MRNAINWFEIPVTDLPRAMRCYEALLGVSLKREVFAGVDQAIFSGEDGAVRGALILEPATRAQPGGTIVYLNCAPSLEAALARAKDAGVEVVMPLTHIGPPGFIAMVRDPDGNKIGLHHTAR